MVSNNFIRIEFKEGKGLKYIKKELEKIGWKNLQIGPYHRNASGIDKIDGGLFCAWDLRGFSPNYKGPYLESSGYNETIAITLKKELLGKVVQLSLRKDISNIF